MLIEQFINDKVVQMVAYVGAVTDESLHHAELDQFISDTMGEWTLLNVTEETPSNAQERVFWYLIYEISFHGALALNHNLFFKSEMNTCLEFFRGVGSYPIDCIGWRPIA